MQIRNKKIKRYSTNPNQNKAGFGFIVASRQKESLELFYAFI